MAVPASVLRIVQGETCAPDDIRWVGDIVNPQVLPADGEGVVPTRLHAGNEGGSLEASGCGLRLMPGLRLVELGKLTFPFGGLGGAWDGFVKGNQAFERFPDAGLDVDGESSAELAQALVG